METKMEQKEPEKNEGQIFISYARTDNEDGFVEKLYTALCDRGHDVWWDEKRMKGAESFPKQISNAIAKTGRMIGIISPDSLKSDPVWQEWKYGCLYTKSFIPILRRGDYKKILKELVALNCPEFFEKHPSELIPEYILSLHCIDFSGTYEDLTNEKPFLDLCETLDEPVILGELSKNIKKPPPCYVPRPEVLRKLFDVVLTDQIHNVIVEGEDRITVIHGRGGSGKSVIAWSFAKSLITRRAFKDGIVWLKIGQKADKLSAVQSLGAFFGKEPLKQADDLEKAKIPLEEALEDKSCLVILDDVWNEDPVSYFYHVLGKDCRLLCTSRNENCVGDINGKLVPLGKLKEEQAKRIMAKWTKVKIDELPSEALELAKECDMLAIAVSLCGALAKRRRNWSQLIEDVKEARTDLRRKFRDYSTEQINFFSPFQVSLNYLKKLDKLGRKVPQGDRVSYKRYKRYLEMVVFGSEIFTPERIITEFWAMRGRKNRKKVSPLIGELLEKALLKLKEETDISIREVSLHNLQQAYLEKKVGKRGVAKLHKYVGQVLLEWWKSNAKKKKKKAPEETQACKYIIDHIYEHFVAGEDYDGLAKLLSNIEYLSGKQEKSIQHKFQDEIVSLLKNLTISDRKLRRILVSTLESIETMPPSKEKADWLDTFGYWLMDHGFKETSGKRADMLKAMSNKYDGACAEVAKKLAEDYEKSGEYDYAVRFAELYTWVCQRAEDFGECLKACTFAEELCRKKGMPEAYQSLGAVEFIRMRASVYKALAKTINYNENIGLAKSAYDEFVKAFASETWMLSIDEWESIEGGKGDVLVPPAPNGESDLSKFKARVVSNTHDCVAAIHLIRFFLENQGQVEWIHHRDITLDQLSSDDVLFTALIGGPKAPDRSKVAYEFYKYEEKLRKESEGKKEKTDDQKYESKYLQMYSGMHIKAFRLEMQRGCTHCYMLGGISKVNTLMAAYNFTKDAEVMEIIKKQK